MEHNLRQEMGKADKVPFSRRTVDNFVIDDQVTNCKMCVCSKMLLFVGNVQDSKSTLGGVLCIFGNRTFMPLSWMSRNQAAALLRRTEAEMISLDAGLPAMAATRETSRFGEGAVASSFIDFRTVQKAKPRTRAETLGRLQSWRRRLARANIRTEQRGLCELRDLPSSVPEPSSTNESDEDDFDYGALRVRPLQIPDRNETDQQL